jgi:hypothetical protein
MTPRGTEELPAELRPETLDKFRKLKNGFPTYAERCLKIRPKVGELVPFKPNRVQLHLHGRLEAQRARTGKVRAIILKGRQEGCSTYVEGRFYHKATWNKGLRAFILTHKQDATDNLFEMASRFHEHCPEAVKPSTGASNAKELYFDRLDSGYRVATAGGAAAGRSQTNQLFHGSEVAFWENAQDHAAGALQTVPDMPGTEVILESTANGVGNYFHGMWLDAERGASEFEAIFIPWFWAPEYRKAVADGFKLEPEEVEYMEAHGLDREQMAWRRAKIQELRDEALFRQEYPATAAEAFESTGEDVYIPGPIITRARTTKVSEPYGALILGVDPSRFGSDAMALIFRRGRKAFGLKRYRDKDTMQAAALIAELIDEHEGDGSRGSEDDKIDRVFIDVGGVGAGVYDRLVQMGYGDIVVAVNFGGKPVTTYGEERYTNRRAEMGGLMKEWLMEPPCEIPNDDVLHGDLMGPRYTYDSNQRLRLERKEDMRKRGLPSPDSGDALALTFAEPVALPEVQASNRRWRNRPRTGSWMTQ